MIGIDGQPHTSDQATIWRWRTAFQHDFAARMDWTIRDVAGANHNPRVVVNGQPGKAPITVDAVVGTPLTLDATGTTDPDKHTLTYSWFFYPEAGGGIPGHPLVEPQGGPAEPVGEGTGLRLVTPRIRIEQPSAMQNVHCSQRGRDGPRDSGRRGFGHASSHVLSPRHCSYQGRHTVDPGVTTCASSISGIS